VGRIHLQCHECLLIYFPYQETKMQSLEKIDFIFAKGFTEQKSYVMVAKELPMMAGDTLAIEKMMKYGFTE